MGRVILIKCWLICLLTLPSMVYAEVYKWVDEHGQVHYGDRPRNVTEADDQKMDIVIDNTVAPIAEDRKERRQKLIDAIDEENRQKQEAEQKQAAKQAKLTQQCLWARDTLKRYQRAGYLYDLDESGNRVALPDNVREAQIKELTEKINKNCQ